MQFEESVETRGHLLDSGVLARVLDDVLEYGGDYRIDRLDLGREHEDESYARLTLGAPDEDLLQSCGPGRPGWPRNGCSCGCRCTASTRSTPAWR